MKKLKYTVFIGLATLFICSCSKNQFCACHSDTNVPLSYTKAMGNYYSASDDCVNSSPSDTITCMLIIPN